MAHGVVYVYAYYTRYICYFTFIPYILINLEWLQFALQNKDICKHLPL